MERQKVSLDLITVDESLNVREGLDDDTIERYVESFEQLPPVVVFEVDST